MNKTQIIKLLESLNRDALMALLLRATWTKNPNHIRTLLAPRDRGS
jgi:hypothetical protein